jgi:protein-disulfide isomerase
VAARLKLIGLMLAVVLLGYAVGGAIDALRLPGRDVPLTSTVRELQADRLAPSAGASSALVTVVIFTDYRCAVCRRDHPGISAVIASEPRARFVFKEWAALGPASKEAARVALAARYQGRYLIARDALMQGRTPDIDRTRLGQDQARNRVAIDAELTRAARQAFALGLPGTPAYLIGQRLVIGSLSERQMRRLIDQAASGG